jgi:hypothetical protein
MDPNFSKYPEIIKEAVRRADLDSLDESSLRKLSNKALAKWQNDYADSLPHQILASQEWTRRHMKRELQSARYAAWIGVFGSIAGALAGALIAVTLGG